MAKSFKLEIVTPENLFYKGEVEMIIVSTFEGDEGFMAGHTWACKLLDVGEIWIQEKGSTDFRVAAAARGFIDVKDEVMIFTDAAEWDSDIDLDRALSEKARAELWLSQHNPAESDEDELLHAKISLDKALTRMKVAKGGGRRRKA